MTVIELIKTMCDDENIVIIQNPRKDFPLTGSIEELMENEELTAEILERNVVKVGYSTLYNAIGVETEWWKPSNGKIEEIL